MERPTARQLATGPGATTLPMRLYSAIQLGVTPQTNAACTIMIGLVPGVVIVSSLLKRGHRWTGDERAAQPVFSLRAGT